MPGLSYRIRGDQSEMAGFIKLERCLLSKSIFNNEKLLKVWIWCLLKATYKEYTEIIGRQEVVIQPGQFTTGRFKAGEELNMNSSTAWSYLKLLQKNQSIDIKSNNKFSVVTIVNWALYQLDKNNSDNKSDNKKTTDEQQMNTNKNIKNDKNVKKSISSCRTNKFADDAIELILACELYNFVLANNPKAVKPNLQTWAKEFDLTMRIDKRSIEDVRKIMEWSQKDSFWQGNIQSPSSLRKQFDKLTVQMKTRVDKATRGSTATQDKTSPSKYDKFYL